MIVPSPTTATIFEHRRAHGRAHLDYIGALRTVDTSAKTRTRTSNESWRGLFIVVRMILYDNGEMRGHQVYVRREFTLSPKNMPLALSETNAIQAFNFLVLAFASQRQSDLASEGQFTGNSPYIPFDLLPERAAGGSDAWDR